MYDIEGVVDAVYAYSLPRSLATRTYGDVRMPDTRRLMPFKVGGAVVMAYSRKDAIKRIKHKKK